MGAPQLEILGGGGGSSPSSSKNTMFNIGKFKVTKPMFYIGGVAIMLLLVLFVRSRNAAQVQSGYTFYPDGTEMIDNGVDVEAKLQNYSNMMENTLQGALTQMGNDMNYAMNDMRQEQNLLASELRQEQSSIVAEIRQSNSSLQSSLQSMLQSQLSNLQQSYQPVTQSYQPSSYSPIYESAPTSSRTSSSNSTGSIRTSWDYVNTAPQEDYATSTNQAAYQQQMNAYLNEVNSTRQDTIQYGISTGDWQPNRYFESTRNPQNFYYDTNSGNLEYSAQYYKDSEFSSRMAAAEARERGDMATAAIWEKEQQKAIEAMNKSQQSNLTKG